MVDTSGTATEAVLLLDEIIEEITDDTASEMELLAAETLELTAEGLKVETLLDEVATIDGALEELDNGATDAEGIVMFVVEDAELIGTEPVELDELLPGVAEDAAELFTANTDVLAILIAAEIEFSIELALA